MVLPLLLNVALGAVLTIVLAWGPALLDDKLFLHPPSNAVPILCREPWVKGLHSEGVWASSCRLSSPTVEDMTAAAQTDGPPRWAVIPPKDYPGFVLTSSVGVPLRCLRGVFELAPSASRAVPKSTGWLDLKIRSIPHALPARVYWPGMLADIAVVAALLTGSSFIASALSRRHRRKHHRCPSCNYPLTALTTTRCPECGTPIASPPN
jgi:hypothetical protein